MSEDIFQDRPKFSKKRGGGVGGNNGPPNDYKQPKRNHNRDYPNYESKGYDKPPRDQNGPSKGSYSPAYDEYGSKPPRNDNYQPYKGKPHNSKQRTPNVWRKKTNKISKESILETFARVKPHKDIDEWVKDYKELFVKEPQPPVNEQVFQFDPNEAIVTKTSRPPPSGGPQKEPENQPSAPETGNNANKGLQMYDFAQERYDPILEMRKMKKGSDKPEKKSGQKEQGLDELLEDESSIKALGGHQKFGGLEGELGGKNEEELGGLEKEYGFDDDDQEKFSDVDARFEKKLKNHEIQEVYEDAFDDLLEPSDKKGQLEMMENSERPVWEILDTNQVIEDIKHEDFLSTLPQDKSVIFGKDYVKREPKKQEQSNFEDQHDKHFNNNFDFDFSKVGFHDAKASDDFPLKGIDDDDLFPSTFNQGIQQKGNLYGQEAGGNPSFMNQMNFSNPMMQQQGNMARLAQQNPNMMNNLPSFFQFQQMQQQMPHMPQMMQMPRNQQQMQQMNQMNQMNPMEIMAKMGVKYPTTGNPNFIPPMKPSPQQKEMPVAGFPRQQLNPTYPSFIFKHFSPDYDAKLWFYLDLQKNTQGPFSGRIMDEWYANGHLPLTLRVSIGKGNTWKPMNELADLIVDRALEGDFIPPRGRSREGRHLKNMQQQGGGFSGVADLLKNRPDLAQFGANTQASVGGKAKGLDEVEKFGQFPHQREQNFQEYSAGGGGGNYYYHQKGGQNGPSHGEFGGQGQYYQKNAMKKGGYPMGGQGGYDYNREQMGVDSPNKNLEGQNMNKMMSYNPSSATNLSGSTDFSAKNKEQNDKPQQDQAKEGQKTEGGQGEPLQNVNDMTNHLKNILGLSLGGGMLNIGGLATPETANTRATAPVEPTFNPQKIVERPQQTQQQNERFYHQPHNHHYHHHEKQEKPEKQSQQQQQTQNQRKGSKAPKIDTADFPSLGEAYK